MNKVCVVSAECDNYCNKIKGLILLTQGLLVKCTGISTGQVSCNREQNCSRLLLARCKSMLDLL